MSKIKSPSEKKRASLTRDRRNVFGESPHAARKIIPKSKAMEHQRERHVAKQTLAEVFVSDGVDALDIVEGQVTTRSRLKRLSGFKKLPDQPLGKVIERKAIRRAAQTSRRKETKNA